jgi:arabinose-5-phosphate isomerase
MGLTMSNKKVSELMIGMNDFPLIHESDSLKKALDSMTKFGLGFACIVDEAEKLIGVLSDGDLRRLLLTRQNPLPALLVNKALDFSARKPVSIHASASSDDCLAMMKKYRVSDLPVVSEANVLIGVIHFHDLI